MKNIIFYLPNLASISTSESDFLSRLNLYASYVAKLSDGQVSKVNFVSTTPTLGDSKYEYLTSHIVSRNLLIRFWQLARLLRKSSYPTTIVAGDNFGALLLSLLLRKLDRRTTVQSSIHGKLDTIWKEPGLKSLVKKLLLKRFIPCVDSLRLVDESEIAIAENMFKLSSTKIFVAPVPIDLPHSVWNFLDRRPRIVAFVGRIHRERGILEWQQIAHKIAIQDRDVKFIVVGNGPLEASMRKSLSPISTRVDFRGFLSKSELAAVWKEVGLLLICAPSESYGMAAREALVNGVPVVARSNSASEYLKFVSPNAVSTYNEIEDAYPLILGKLDAELKREWFDDYLRMLKVQQEKSLTNLARSWLA